MNDQRQVIFSQRLKILKEDNISAILNDFFEEIITNLDTSKKNYQKSNDEKYLTEIKNITGNALNDSQLIKLISKESGDFKSEMKDLFLKKQKSRIDILGDEQNKSLEKKNFFTDN